MNEHICDYGCGKVAHFYFKGVKKWCCEEKWQRCPAKRIFSDKHKKNISKSRSHEPLSKITKEKLKISIKKLWANKEYRDKQSKSRTGLKRSNKFKDEQSKKFMGHPGYNKRTIEKIKKKYPLFSKIEEMRYNPDNLDKKEIQVHCKNHNCPNSKEKGGWFTPTSDQFYGRIGAIENPIGFEEQHMYCSQHCKDTCPLYGKSANQLIKQDQINAGYIPEENLGTPPGYETFKQEVLKRNIKDYGDLQCEICGNTNKDELCVHHEKPIKINPEQSLDPDNGWILCSFGKGNNCHLKYGHPKGSDCSNGNLAKLVCERKYRN